MTHSSQASTTIHCHDAIELVNSARQPDRADYIKRFELSQPITGALRIAAQLRTDRVVGPPGQDCALFFNVEYKDGPIFWDTFLYPDTGTTGWHELACHVRPRGDIKCIEMHACFRTKGTLQIRQVTIEAVEQPPDDSDYTIAVFGDSTDMTCYLPTEHRLVRRFELLLRDRFRDHLISVHNLAEGGDHLKHLLDSSRLARDLRIIPNCNMVMVRYGLNDLGRKIEPAAFKRQLRTVCDMIAEQQPGATVVLSTTIPPSASSYDEQTVQVAKECNLTLLRLDDHIRSWSEQGEWDWHHEPQSRFGRRRDQNPPDNPTGLDGDKHPNAYGSQRIAEFYFAKLEAVIAKSLA